MSQYPGAGLKGHELPVGAIRKPGLLRRPLVPKDQGPKRQDLGSTGPDPREDVPFKGVPFKGWVQGSVVIETELPPSLSAAARDLIRMLLAIHFVQRILRLLPEKPWRHSPVLVESALPLRSR